jgi:hypothetical protein
MKRGLSLIVVVVVGILPTQLCAQQHTTRSSSAKSSPNVVKQGHVVEHMRLTTKSDQARELFGQAIILSGNYRLDECLKSLRTAVSEDPDFAAGWSLLTYFRDGFA